jgi:hypothetical protein
MLLVREPSSSPAVQERRKEGEGSANLLSTPSGSLVGCYLTIQ